MKKLQILILALLCGNALAQTTDIRIIPEPVSVTRSNGTFTLPQTVIIETGDQSEIKTIATLLGNRIGASTGYSVSQVTRNSSATIHLALNTPAQSSLGNEGYSMTITPTDITIKANRPAGLYYGVQTMMQVFPTAIESGTPVKGVQWVAPCVSINDYPRFAWRGLMLDVSRHFFTKQEVMAFIDQMSKYKFNLLHWHLTDDEGWRVEIKSLPKLTEVGAWNVKRVGTFGNFSKPTPDEPRNYGGFYTQDDIREVVRYAQERFVNILPEVDVPGHSLSAVASYPELSCTPGADQYKVRSGEMIMDWHAGGFTALIDNTLCPANEKVYSFLDKVFSELSQLFPFDYIHVGGDECAKNFWEKSDAIKNLMQKEKLKTMEEVQSYFEKRVSKIIEAKGKKLIGWDEILEGGLAPNAVVMSWRGIQGGIEAAKQGHEVVMSPAPFVYLDYMQSDRTIEPPVYATLRLKKVYSFEPVPEGVDSKFVKGGQANIWTEQIYNARHLQYMVWPRSFAVAESVWSPKEKKEWNGFVKRVESSFERFDYEHVRYSPALYDPVIVAKKDGKDSLEVELSTEVEGLDIYYSFDNSSPDNYYPKYDKPLSIPKDASLLRVVSYKGDKPVGRQIDIPVSELRQRAARKRGN